MRLQRFLALAGKCSRREGEVFIAEGRVSVDGVIVASMGAKVEANQEVRLDGRVVWLAVRREYVILHKPRGFLVTASDPEKRKTIYDLLPPHMARLRYVGRLDRNSEGLVILTDDGDAANRLAHPSYGSIKVYRVVAEGLVGPEALARLETGVPLEDGPAKVLKATEISVSKGRTEMVLTIAEGRKHIIRRMMDEVGHPVKRLMRLSMGPIQLGGLQPGEWRKLNGAEIVQLRQYATDAAEENK